MPATEVPSEVDVGREAAGGRDSRHRSVLRAADLATLAASMWLICSGNTCPLRNARRTTSCCAKPFGALMAVDRPS